VCPPRITHSRIKRPSVKSRKQRTRFSLVVSVTTRKLLRGRVWEQSTFPTPRLLLAAGSDWNLGERRLLAAQIDAYWERERERERRKEGERGGLALNKESFGPLEELGFLDDKSVWLLPGLHARSSRVPLTSLALRRHPPPPSSLASHCPNFAAPRFDNSL